MDASTILTYSAVAVGILSGIATFFNKKALEARIALLQTGNDEVRSQNTDLRAERTDLVAQLAACKARDEEKERLIDNYKKQPNLTGLTRLISSNHKEIMAAITGKYDGKK